MRVVSDIEELERELRKNVYLAGATLLLMFLMSWPASWLIFRVAEPWMEMPTIISVVAVYYAAWCMFDVFRDRYKEADKKLGEAIAAERER